MFFDDMAVIQKSITLPEDVASKATRYAKDTGRTFSSLIRVSLEKFINEEKGGKQ